MRSLELYEKSWSDLKSILTYNSMYFDYDVQKNMYIIKVQRTALIGYVHYMDIIDSEDDDYEGSDCEDFEDNWMDKAGPRSWYRKSWKWTVKYDDTNEKTLYKVPGGSFTDSGGFFFRYINPVTTAYIEAFLYAGIFKTDGNAVFGDRIEIAVVDKDNIYGYGAGTVIRPFVDEYLEDGKNIINIEADSPDYMAPFSKIPNGLYGCVKYYYESNATYDYEVQCSVGSRYEY